VQTAENDGTKSPECPDNAWWTGLCCLSLYC